MLNIIHIPSSSYARKLGIFLNADYLITGSYNFIDDTKVAINVQVYSTDKGLLIFERNYKDDIVDIFEMMNQLSLDVQKNINY